MMMVVARSIYQRVVPANAGTNNHRRRLLQKGIGHSASLMNHAVWVPAFAGTTIEGMI
jgi:hypothetical protein